MRCRLFTFCSALSLLLSVAVVALWVRSQWVFDGLMYYYRDTDISGKTVSVGFYRLGTERQRLHVMRHHLRIRPTDDPSSVRLVLWVQNGLTFDSRPVNPNGTAPYQSSPLRTQLWFDSKSPGVQFPAVEWNAWIPAWAVALPFALGGLPVLLRLKQAIRHAIRRSQMRCVACGYDLRATPDRCPECGTTKATA